MREENEVKQFTHLELPTEIDPKLNHYGGILKGAQLSDQDIEDAKYEYLVNEK